MNETAGGREAKAACLPNVRLAPARLASLARLAALDEERFARGSSRSPSSLVSRRRVEGRERSRSSAAGADEPTVPSANLSSSPCPLRLASVVQHAAFASSVRNSGHAPSWSSPPQQLCRTEDRDKQAQKNSQEQILHRRQRYFFYIHTLPIPINFNFVEIGAVMITRCFLLRRIMTGKSPWEDRLIRVKEV
jgi:hypothetical protein